MYFLSDLDFLFFRLSAQKTHTPQNRLIKKLIRHKGKDISVASIREKQKDGIIVSYQFIACLGRDEQGKQLRQGSMYTIYKNKLAYFVNL